jgi:hypothetical protein
MAGTYPVTFVDEMGPHSRSVKYVIQIPGAAAGISDHAFGGPVDCTPAGQIYIQTAHTASTADHFKLTVLGSFDSPTITPSARTWVNARGDMASGAAGLNNTLLAVTMGGHITVVSPARSYRFRVCGPTANTNAITITVLAVNPR